MGKKGKKKPQDGGGQGAGPSGGPPQQQTAQPPAQSQSPQQGPRQGDEPGGWRTGRADPRGGGDAPRDRAQEPARRGSGDHQQPAAAQQPYRPIQQPQAGGPWLQPQRPTFPSPFQQGGQQGPAQGQIMQQPPRGDGPPQQSRGGRGGGRGQGHQQQQQQQQPRDDAYRQHAQEGYGQDSQQPAAGGPQPGRGGRGGGRGGRGQGHQQHQPRGDGYQQGHGPQPPVTGGPPPAWGAQAPQQQQQPRGGAPGQGPQQQQQQPSATKVSQEPGPAQQQKGPKGQPGQRAGQAKQGARLASGMSQLGISEDVETIDIPDVFKPPGTQCKKRIQVESNHFALKLGSIKQAFHYDVEIQENLSEREKQRAESSTSPAKEGRTRKIKDKVQYDVTQKFINKHFKGRFPSYDGRKNLYSSRPLHEDLNQIFYDNNIEVIDDLGKQKSFNIAVKYARTVSLVPKFADPLNRVPLLPQDAIQCIDIVLRNAPVCTFTQVGRSFFKKPTDTIIELGGGMEMYYGFYQSVVMGGKPMLNVHLAHKAFPKNMKVLDAFVEILKSKGRWDAQYSYADLEKLNEYQRKDLTSYIKSLKVTYEVPRFPKVTYRVNGLAGLPGKEKLEDGRTILEYFKKEKNYTIRYPNIPLIWVGSMKGSVKIPPELCIIEKDQSLRRKMDEVQTSNMIKVAATDTKKHKANTMNRFRDANYNASPYVQEFGFSVNDKFEKMDARVLQPPLLQYQGNRTADVRQGTWRNSNFLKPKNVERWAIVSLDSYCRQGEMDRVQKELVNASRQCGIQFMGNPDMIAQIRMRNPRQGPNQAELEQFFNEQKSKEYNIIFVILPNFNADAVYSSIKNASEIKAGCLTQCIKSATVKRINAMTALNILLKVNGKLDGVNHTFVTKPFVLQDKRPFMLLGADVTHPGPLAGDIPSVAAIIASHDPTGFQYNVTIRLQEPKMEYIVDLKNVVKEQLMFFFRKNRAKPEKIFYFRDGVSEGQFSHVLCMELKAIQTACYELQRDGYNPKIAFLVVQKRHHTRLFPVNDRDSEDQGRPDRPGNFNVPAGTCVDTDIVDPNRQNFYLVSHASIKGVSRPTKYCTLYDDMDLTNDQIQELTYYLCHMFARCNRSVSYPAPTYYAHLGALRGKAYIKPALDKGDFKMDQLQTEQAKIKTLESIHFGTPMFFI